MGADIHLVLEQRDDMLGWVGLHNFSQDILRASTRKGWTSFPARERNYDLFAALANVRGEGPEPKGLPSDASALTRLRLSELDSDLHSHTWYPLAEALALYVRHYDEIPAQVAAKLTGDEQERPPLERYFGLNLIDPNDIKNYRLCIAFDN
jgi:hypothetical protein